jgi:gamma-glutamyltranspeptidase/glutathione hydrolase
MFILFWDAAEKKVKAMNGSGRAGAACSIEAIRRDVGIPDGKIGKMPFQSAHAVTVPGAAAGWVDTVERFGSGKLDLATILAPAIQLGEKGFPVSEVASHAVCLYESIEPS